MIRDHAGLGASRAFLCVRNCSQIDVNFLWDSKSNQVLSDWSVGKDALTAQEDYRQQNGWVLQGDWFIAGCNYTDVWVSCLFGTRENVLKTTFLQLVSVHLNKTLPTNFYMCSNSTFQKFVLLRKLISKSRKLKFRKKKNFVFQPFPSVSRSRDRFFLKVRVRNRVSYGFERYRRIIDTGYSPSEHLCNVREPIWFDLWKMWPLSRLFRPMTPPPPHRTVKICIKSDRTVKILT